MNFVTINILIYSSSLIFSYIPSSARLYTTTKLFSSGIDKIEFSSIGLLLQNTKTRLRTNMSPNFLDIDIHTESMISGESIVTDIKSKYDKNLNCLKKSQKPLTPNPFKNTNFKRIMGKRDKITNSCAIVVFVSGEKVSTCESKIFLVDNEIIGLTSKKSTSIAKLHSISILTTYLQLQIFSIINGKKTNFHIIHDFLRGNHNPFSNSKIFIQLNFDQYLTNSNSVFDIFQGIDNYGNKSNFPQNIDQLKITSVLYNIRSQNTHLNINDIKNLILSKKVSREELIKLESSKFTTYLMWNKKFSPYKSYKNDDESEGDHILFNIIIFIILISYLFVLFTIYFSYVSPTYKIKK